MRAKWLVIGIALVGSVAMAAPAAARLRMPGSSRFSASGEAQGRTVRAKHSPLARRLATLGVATVLAAGCVIIPIPAGAPPRTEQVAGCATEESQRSGGLVFGAGLLFPPVGVLIVRDRPAAPQPAQPGAAAGPRDCSRPGASAGSAPPK